jgi:uncharacterized protein YegL
MEQVPFGVENYGTGATFGTNSFADNPEPRVPCILVLDVSLSMEGERIRELNGGLRTYRDELLEDSLAAKRAEVAIITFGGTVQKACDFTTAESFVAPELSVHGHTPMGEAITLALNMIDERKAVYRANGVQYFRPWIFVITDGEPNDEWRSVIPRIKEGEERKAFSFFAVAVEGANLDILKQISVRQPLTLKGLRFRDLFVWLSRSQKSVSRSTPGEEVPLSNPATPEGWAAV